MRHADVIMFGLQLAALVSVALLFGHIARRLKQPVVLGELIGGVILGPTILGGFAPQLYSGIFTVSPSAIVARDTVANFGLFAFLFVAGMEMDFSDFRSQTRGIGGLPYLA